MSIALIPNVSAYAKILEGALAFKQNQIDRALLLLLPIQADAHLTTAAKILLHQTLAQAFQSLNDTQQALQHFILTELALSKAQNSDSASNIADNHDRIWHLLKPLKQTELVALRGNNTDTVFQGWIDLALAANSLDSNSIANWNTLYTDHPALEFANSLSKNAVSTTQTPTSLALSGSIAVILPAPVEANAEKIEAFKLGLETALNLAAIPNPIEIYYPQQAQQDLTALYTQAMTEGGDYLIMPNLDDPTANSYFEQVANKKLLHLSLSFSDEAHAIFKFASKNSMQHISVVTTQHAASQQMLASIQQAWSQSAETSDSSAIHTIVLATDVLAEPIKLLDLKSQIAANIHDMVILAMPASDVVKIRPYLDISTPTITFSSIHDIADENDNLKLLNALRFVDMPFLVESDQSVSDYQGVAANLSDKTLLRWFALGADSLRLLISSEKSSNQAFAINGLAGNYNVSESGEIKRSSTSARFNQSGAISD
jgi:outer membrane PBP1 activator LpoA protein